MHNISSGHDPASLPSFVKDGITNSQFAHRRPTGVRSYRRVYSKSFAASCRAAEQDLRGRGLERGRLLQVEIKVYLG